jgi:hypothetical protein
MSSYTSGKHAFGFCDRTGFRYPLHDLVLVGKDVVDPDQPQLHLGKVRASDPQALRNPRPDQNLSESRGLFGWNPVGSPDVATDTGTGMQSFVGVVTVSTD